MLSKNSKVSRRYFRNSTLNCPLDLLQTLSLNVPIGLEIMFSINGRCGVRKTGKGHKRKMTEYKLLRLSLIYKYFGGRDYESRTMLLGINEFCR